MIFHENRLPADNSHEISYALFVIFEKPAKFENCCLLQIIGRALWVRLMDKKIITRLHFNFSFSIHMDLFLCRDI